MLFNSYVFIFAFLPVTFVGYYLLNYKKYFLSAKIFLIFASLFFYAWWNVKYLPILIFSIVFNYFTSMAILSDKKLNKKFILIFGICVNIALLGYFKYADFFIDNLNFTLNLNINSLNLALPLALSFVTFQQIAYLTDCYKVGIAKESKNSDEVYQIDKNFLNYCTFITFFPQLIAGPIVHHKEMMPQFASFKNKFINYRHLTLGLFIFSIGLFKKVVLADTFALVVNAGFTNTAVLNFIEAWATSLSYTFQLYFDFSGYCDMAIGLALMFNIKLPLNFNSPYKSLNIQEFWRRWHITLGRFLTRYLYFPLGGSRVSNKRTYLNLMIVFLISGLWHGAGWTFVFWGFLHGVAIVIHRIWSNLGFKMHKLAAIFITFNFVNIAWVFFRANNFKDALNVLRAMFDLTNIALPIALSTKLGFLAKYGIIFNNYTVDSHLILKITFYMVFAFISVFFLKNSILLSKTKRKNYLFALYCGFIFAISILTISVSTYSEFIYFNF